MAQKIVDSRIRELIGPFIVLHHVERSKTVAIDQDRVIKRYSTSQTRLCYYSTLCAIDLYSFIPLSILVIAYDTLFDIIIELGL